jgi:hypothetical protein
VACPHTILTQDGGYGPPPGDNRSARFWLIWQKDVQAKNDFGLGQLSPFVGGLCVLAGVILPG